MFTVMCKSKNIGIRLKNPASVGLYHAAYQVMQLYDF